MIHFINVWVEFESDERSSLWFYWFTGVVTTFKKRRIPQRTDVVILEGNRGHSGGQDFTSDRWCKTLKLWQRSAISSHVESLSASHCEKRVKIYIYPTEDYFRRYQARLRRQRRNRNISGQRSTHADARMGPSRDLGETGTQRGWRGEEHHIPSLSGIAENLRRNLQKHNIPGKFTPRNTLRQELGHRKERRRCLRNAESSTMVQPRRATSSGQLHLQQTGHPLGDNLVWVPAREDHWWERRRRPCHAGPWSPHQQVNDPADARQ